MGGERGKRRGEREGERLSLPLCPREREDVPNAIRSSLTLAAAKLRFNDSDKKNRTAVMLLLAALSPNPWVLAKSRKSESGSADCWAKKHRVISVAACKHEAGEENKEQKGKQKESVFEGASERLSERERQTDTQTRKK